MVKSNIGWRWNGQRGSKP